MSTPLTLMAVHAHLDDESSSTCGVLARYADDGVRTVVARTEGHMLRGSSSGERRALDHALTVIADNLS